MCILMSLMPATFWTIIGYFILLSSTKVEGQIKTLGQVLAVWVFVLVGLILIAGVYATVGGYCSMDTILQKSP